jgi:cytochrome oxidase Cu insertion factor (SCO1/SenC/PrrC family)
MRRMLFAIACSAAVLSHGSTAQARPWGANYIPNLGVTTQNGEALRFYDDLIKGKIVIISFIYTSCTDLCPLTTARMAQLEEKLGDAVGRDVFMLSMTVDPEMDTPNASRSIRRGSEPGRVGLS